MFSSSKHIQPSQYHEDDPARVVLVHEPATAVFMASLNPVGSLFEHPINIEHSQLEHKYFQSMLREHGCTVYTVAQVLQMGADIDRQARKELEDFAFSRLEYRLLQPILTEEAATASTDQYKRSVIQKMSAQDLVRVILTKPLVSLRPAERNTALVTESISFRPTGNLVFTRDQQITTPKGVVIARFSAPQRRDETLVMKFCFRKLGITPIGEIPEGATLEGGDFLALGEELAMLGVGLRTNYRAARYLMDNDLLGTERFAVVRDIFDTHQDRMHLDCILSPVSRDLCVIDESVLGRDNMRRRMVDEYARNPEGGYTLRRANIELGEYLRSNGFDLIPLPGDFQLAYGCNMLNLGNSNVLTVHSASAELIRAHPKFKGTVTYLPFRGITSMFGSLHCASQVLLRDQVKGRKLPAIPALRPVDGILYIPLFCSPAIKRFQEENPTLYPGMSSRQLQKLISDELWEASKALEEQGVSVYHFPRSVGSPILPVGELGLTLEGGLEYLLLQLDKLTGGEELRRVGSELRLGHITVCKEGQTGTCVPLAIEHTARILGLTARQLFIPREQK
eukprot:gnl/Dysnectes_brevis/1876_a2156_1864.p1 GENE.gnl/Dysnectes_brevis/1876_a2156_1864~~gnl/Dysnectes_brevis/1876_a2156_1864.p1  ORF type:complete len:566 (+),score=248.86 gnl/Dysnectes_brevis/1876_a2156_1864:109-1806(+)